MLTMAKAKKDVTPRCDTLKALPKQELIKRLVERTGLTREQISSLFACLSTLTCEELKRVGELTIPGLLKFKIVTKPALPERMGKDPFTKQERLFKAQPARVSVKAVPVKALRDTLS